MAPRPSPLSTMRLVLGRLWIPLMVFAAMAASAVACIKPAPTSLSTSLSSGGKEGAEITVVEGAKVKDRATLSGENASKATGTVKYAVYKDKECKELATKAGEVTVKEGKVPDSEEKELKAGAVYYWQAEYGGDSLDEPSTSPCSKEVLTVKAKTTLTTKLSGGGKEGEEITVVEGAKVKDTATLSGTNSSTATGTVKYAVYKDKECKELVAKAGEVTVKEGKVPSSEEKELEAGAVYYWQAEYGGDSLHEPSTSPCSKEVLTVKAKTTLKTTLAGEGQSGEEITVQEAAAVTDTATLSGTSASTATGMVEYAVYADEKCKELVTKAGEVTVKEGKVPASEEVELATGSVYFWQATYSGDSTHEPSEGVCGVEVEVVAENTSLSTLLLGVTAQGEEIEPAESIEIEEEAVIADTATLSGTNAAEATGSVRYSVYSDEECTELAAEAGVVEVEGESVPASEFIDLPAGTYYWQAQYFGDPLNKGSVSPCGSEVSVVTKLAITTLLSGEEQSGERIEVQESSAVSDVAFLNGPKASEATGTVSYSIYEDEECKELVTKAGEVTVKEGKVPASEAVKLAAGGTYYWQAEYSGDKENPAAISACGSEIMVVAESTSLTTLLSGEGKSGEEIHVQEEAPVTDTATLSGVNASEATGTVEYSVYSDNKCTELVAGAGTVEVEGASVPASAEVKLHDGTYYWQAQYFGDPLNKGSVSPCGSEVVVVDTASITTSLSSEVKSGTEIEVQEKVPVMDTATLHIKNAATATGIVSYSIYEDEECKELVTKAGEVTVKEGKVPASEAVELTPGTYYWVAHYSGDPEHGEATSICGVEVQIVVAREWIISVGDSYIVGEGGRWAGNTGSNSEHQYIDALGSNAYKSRFNGELSGEKIPGCHRSHSAEVFIRLTVLNRSGWWIEGKNLACSGAETKSRNEGGEFKPGLDFIRVRRNRDILPGSNPTRGTCPITECLGQALLLEEFAKKLKEDGEKVKMIVVSIGGNNFRFPQVVEACVWAYLTSSLPWSSLCSETQGGPFVPVEAVRVRGEIESGIINVGNAVKNAGFNPAEFTILVQDYPSPIPATAGTFAFPESVRRKRCGAPFLNADAAWASTTALPVIEKTVKEAAENVQEGGLYTVKFLELEKAFNGRRLCELGTRLVHSGAGSPFRWRWDWAPDVSEWVNQVRIRPGNPFSQNEGFHPNYWGQLALRNCLRLAYNNGTPLGNKKCVIKGPGREVALEGRYDWQPEPIMKLE